MIVRSLLASMTMVALVSSAWGATLTAVCKDPKGRTIGIEGQIGGNKPIDAPDYMRGQFTLIWEVGKDEAQVISTVVRGAGPLLERALRVHSSDESVTFVVTYPRGVWLYSIFWKPGRLLITRHSEGYALNYGGAIAVSMEAPCDVSFK